MCFLAGLKSVYILLLNMCNILELSELFVCLGVGDFYVFHCLGGQKKNTSVDICYGIG